MTPASTVAHRQAKQKWHITLDRSFPATANARNEAMMREAGDFAVHLKRCEKDIRTLKNATEGENRYRELSRTMAPHPLPSPPGVCLQPPCPLQSPRCGCAGLLMTTKIVLSAPLPRVYEETGNGRVAAMAAVAGQPSTLIGGDFKVEELTRISKETVRPIADAFLAVCAMPTAFDSSSLGLIALLAARLMPPCSPMRRMPDSLSLLQIICVTVSGSLGCSRVVRRSSACIFGIAQRWACVHAAGPEAGHGGAGADVALEQRFPHRGGASSAVDLARRHMP